MQVVKQTFCYLSLLVVIVGVLAPAGILADASYRYYCRITVDNTAGSSGVTEPFYFLINADSLADAGWIQDDFQDIKLVSGSTEQYLTITNTGSTTAKWRMDFTTVSAGNTVNRYLWFGNTTATRNQVWISSSTDTMSASDDATLDITTDLTVAGSFYITNTPSGTIDLISKSGAYQLQGTSSSIVFSIDLVTPVDFYLIPNGSGSLTQLDAAQPAGYHWAVVGDGPPLVTPDADYVMDQSTLDGILKYDLYNLTSLSSTLSAYLDTPTSMSICFTGYGNATTEYERPIWQLGGTTAYGTSIELPSGWTSHTQTMTRPGGGEWQMDDLEDLQAGIGLNWVTAAGNWPRCGQVYVTGQLSRAFISVPITIGEWTDVRGSYDGSTLSLYVNDILQASATVSSSIQKSESPVLFCDFDGYADNIYIGDTDTETPNKVAEYTFEPLDISATTIQDVSSNTNTISYTWMSNNGDVDITVDKVTPYDLSYYSGETVSSDDPEGIPLEFPDEPDNAFDDASFNVIPGSGFINDQLDGAEIPRALFWYTLIMLIAIGAGFLAFDMIRDIMATAIATAGCLIIGAVTDMGIGYVDILAIAIVMIALFARREHSTGRL